MYIICCLCRSQLRVVVLAMSMWRLTPGLLEPLITDRFQEGVQVTLVSTKCASGSSMNHYNRFSSLFFKAVISLCSGVQ